MLCCVYSVVTLNKTVMVSRLRAQPEAYSTQFFPIHISACGVTKALEFRDVQLNE